jgi:hypothetical protein
MDWKTAAFWGESGRIAKIHAGKWAGRYVFAYPEERAGWWVIVVYFENAPGDMYIDDAEYLLDLEREGQFEWLPLGEEESRIEREYFDWRKEFSYETRALTGFQSLIRKLRRRLGAHR